MDIQIGDHVIRNLFQIALILVRNENRFNATTVCRQQFLFQTANQQYLATQGDFAGHCHIGTNRVTRQA